MANELVPKMPPMRGLEIDNISYQTFLRAFDGYASNAFQAKSALWLFEGGGLTRLRIGYDVQALPYGEEGRYNPRDNAIILSVDTYEGLFIDYPRSRFTLAHELGHAILHGRFLKEALEGRMPQRTYKRTDLKPYFDPEWQANRFAGGFLMPAPVLRKCIRDGLSDRRISSYLLVSLSALQKRRKDLKI